MTAATAYDAIDDFAGPGGWDEGARVIGLRTKGYEWDAAACATAIAAGHDREQVDVSLADAAVFRGIVPGYIASPPCTLFSAAGTGVGKLVLDVLADGIRRIFAGEDCRAEVREAIYPVTLEQARAKNAKRNPEKRWPDAQVEEKARSDAFVASLVLEPARRIMDLDPEWIALEQVPEVLPLWQVYVRELRALGYSAWATILCAADYGVPQTRRRAVLGASRVRTTLPPPPTHSEHAHGADLFGDGLLEWVSMADALGWGPEDEPARTISAGGAETGGAEPFANAGYREKLREYVVDRGTNSKAPGWRKGDVTMEPTPPVPVTRPAPTITGQSRGWRVRPAYLIPTNDRPNVCRRTPDEPAPTMAFGHEKPRWVFERPSTTVVGSERPDVIAAPGFRTETPRQDAEDSVLVTVAEAGMLQSFPADYPWQGSKGKQYQQVGNAVPPLLAAHVLAAVTGREASA